MFLNKNKVLNKNKLNSLPSELFTKTTWANLSVYGFSHFLVDAICAGIVFSLLNSTLDLFGFAFLLVLYNILAFGLQLPFGILSDKLKSPKYFAVIGVLVTAISCLVVLYSPLAGVCIAGIGNAIFHIGGGSIALSLTPKKASAPGIYVAPGAIGLLFGTILGKSNLFNPFLFVIVALLISVVIISTNHPKINYITKIKTKINYFELAVILLLLAIVSRSIIGFAVSFPWKVDFVLLIVLTIGIFCGKFFGGILGDKFGWIKVGVGGLIISAPLLFFGPQYFVLGIIGMFLFNFTMPITLTALSNIFSGRPGFSFGLTCMALLIGALPFFSDLKSFLANELLIFGIIITSALMLFIALVLILKTNQKLSYINS